MTGEGHLTFSVACVIFAQKAGLTPELAQGDWWHMIPAALLASLLPDIDHPKSILGRRLKWISLPMAKTFGHRGFTHSLLAVIGGVFLFNSTLFSHCFFPPDVLHALLIGYSSHLLADMLTPAGIPLLWPCRWRFKLPFLNTKKNNQSERVFCMLFFGCALCWQSDFSISLLVYFEQLTNFK
ncbi:predicted inner membrane protein regulated by LexA [Candidatus Regiella insecticola LSR1]|uniref:Predicted inner membrane protein regulated by LexA n=1 Tax=Candidatus Regiella insecticola LSR1 TaxID=663321 RepID=E0WSN3_9ENTR|nr:metal-dependent hydrolase [Candidatus Regiella insecticola]EFL92002.1 predicted inner membrane protein regulated by LexA [Candidatus Regiella insecticola LSR1]